MAGGVLAAFVGMLQGSFPNIAAHLLAASVMNAPAGLILSKIIRPEVGEPVTKGTLKMELERTESNVIDAAAGGAQLLRDAHHATHAVRVVGIVDDDLHATDVEAHESPGVVREVVTKCCKHLRDDRRRHAEFRCDKRRAREILDVVGCGSIDRQRHVADGAQVVFAVA